MSNLPGGYHFYFRSVQEIIIIAVHLYLVLGAYAVGRYTRCVSIRLCIYISWRRKHSVLLRRWRIPMPIWWWSRCCWPIISTWIGRRICRYRSSILSWLILDSVLVKRGLPEYPGQNPNDMAVYKNIVRYKIGQEVGGYQTWEHMHARHVVRSTT